MSFIYFLLLIDVYISGGMHPTAILKDIWKFSLKTHKWTYLGDMPEKLYFHGSAVSPVSITI